MAATTSKRVSIKDFHLPFLIEIGRAIGTNDLSEIVNYIICQAKTSPIPITQSPQPGRSTAQTDDDLAASLSGLLD